MLIGNPETERRLIPTVLSGMYISNPVKDQEVKQLTAVLRCHELIFEAKKVTCQRKAQSKHSMRET